MRAINRTASMERRAALERIAGLEMKVAAMEYQAGVTDSLKGLLLKYVAEPLDKYRRHLNLFKMPIDDLLDDVVEVVAPKVSDTMMREEVDADMEEFMRGVEQRQSERRAGMSWSNAMLNPKKYTPAFFKGYRWGDTNDGEVPPSVRKEMIEAAAQEHSKKVVERAMKKALNTINPIEMIKHAYHLIKEFGWDPHEHEIWYKKWTKRGIKIVLIAIGYALVEMLEHYVLPATMVYLTGSEAMWGLATIPMLELVMPVILAYFKKAKVDVQDQVDWYEENYGEIEQALDENAFEGKTASTHFRRRSYGYAY